MDEFQNFATDSFVNILSEARKYRLNLIIAHQYIGQLVTDSSTAVRDAVFGNVGTMVSFRVGATDAEALELEFTPEFLQNDLINLPNYNIYIKLMIDGVTSRPFSAKTLAPPAIDRANPKRNEIIQISRGKYARNRVEAEQEIIKWASGLETPVPAAPAGQTATDLAAGIQAAAAIQNPPASAKPLYQPNGPRAQGGGQSTTLYNATCSNCGKPTKTIFEPKPDRPVYCKSCLKKMKNQKGGAPQKAASPGRPAPTASAPAPDKGGGANRALESLGIEFGSVKISDAPAKQNNSGKRTFDEPRQKIETFSLSEIMKKGEAVFFNPKKAPLQSAKKEVDLQDLKKSLTEALEKIPKQPEKPFDPIRQAQDKSVQGKKPAPSLGIEGIDEP